MKPSIAVLVPVLGRPHAAQPLVDSFVAATPPGLARLVFVASPGDVDQDTACMNTGCTTLVLPRSPGPGDYQKKINYGFRQTVEPWVFTGADDLRFHSGWAEAALEVGEREQVGMVGTDDLGNGLVRAGRHSTHSLFARWYVEQCGTVDEPGLVYHEGYGHQMCDVEAYETAVERDCFAFARESRVEHLHFLWNKGKRDATYDKGMSSTAQDRALLRARRPLWKQMAA